MCAPTKGIGHLSICARCVQRGRGHCGWELRGLDVGGRVSGLWLSEEGHEASPGSSSLALRQQCRATGCPGPRSDLSFHFSSPILGDGKVSSCPHLSIPVRKPASPPQGEQPDPSLQASAVAGVSSPYQAWRSGLCPGPRHPSQWTWESGMKEGESSAAQGVPGREAM